MKDMSKLMFIPQDSTSKKVLEKENDKIEDMNLTLSKEFLQESSKIFSNPHTLRMFIECSYYIINCLTWILACLVNPDLEENVLRQDSHLYSSCFLLLSANGTLGLVNKPSQRTRNSVNPQIRAFLQIISFVSKLNACDLDLENFKIGRTWRGASERARARAMTATIPESAISSACVLRRCDLFLFGVGLVGCDVSTKSSSESRSGLKGFSIGLTCDFLVVRAQSQFGD